MSAGFPIDERLRDLARKVAWEAQIRGFPIRMGAEALAHSLHQAGYFRRHDIERLAEAAFVGQAMRQLGADILASHPDVTIGELQEMVGLEVEHTRIPLIFRILTTGAEGQEIEDYRTVTVEAFPHETVESVLRQGNELAQMVLEALSPTFMGRAVEIEKIGPVA